MKAIVNVKKGSFLHNLNGKTFDVVECMSSIVSLNINGITTDFSHKEIIVVDIEKELQKEYDNFNWGSKNCYNNLDRYREINKIKGCTQIYNCPA